MLILPNKTFLLTVLAAGVLFLFNGCDDSSTGTEIELEVQMAEDIPANPDAPTGGPPTAPTNFTFYSLANGEVVADEDSASTEWDLAFSGTSVLSNGGTSGPGEGGAIILDIAFEDVDLAPSQGYSSDTNASLAIPTGGGNGWYNYTGETSPARAILPIPNKTIIVRTATGNYAKVEILSYYEGNPDTSTDEFADFQTRPANRYYTFRYVVQTDGSRELE